MEHDNYVKYINLHEYTNIFTLCTLCIPTWTYYRTSFFVIARINMFLNFKSRSTSQVHYIKKTKSLNSNVLSQYKNMLIHGEKEVIYI